MVATPIGRRVALFWPRQSTCVHNSERLTHVNCSLTPESGLTLRRHMTQAASSHRNVTVTAGVVLAGLVASMKRDDLHACVVGS